MVITKFILRYLIYYETELIIDDERSRLNLYSNHIFYNNQHGYHQSHLQIIRLFGIRCERPCPPLRPHPYNINERAELYRTQW